MNLVGERVQQARAINGLSQTWLADEIGDITNGAWEPTRDDIYRIEAGTRTCSDLEAIAIAAALGKEVEWLIKGDDPSSTTLDVATSIFGPQRIKPSK